MRYTGLMTDWLELVGGIHCDLQQGTYYTPWYDARQRHRLLFELDVGDIGQGGTVDFEVQQATDSAGAGAVAIAAKAITQLTQAGGDGNDYVCVNLRTEEMNVQGGFCYVRGRLDVLVASANVSVVVKAQPLRYTPPSLAQYTEVVP